FSDALGPHAAKLTVAKIPRHANKNFFILTTPIIFLVHLECIKKNEINYVYLLKSSIRSAYSIVTTFFNHP
ncbi:hypothetical protein, partial [Enterococcus mundtii]|uniref:hypothetical protein n=1 Tax=Enterococcus mundtii TaxID=53346 RepID=UPI001E3D501F